MSREGEFIPGNVPAKRTESSRRKRCVILRSRKREEREREREETKEVRKKQKKKEEMFF